MKPSNLAKYDIPCPPGGEGPLLLWADLKFNPLGLYNLRRRLGVLTKEPGIFLQYKDAFLASDIAWFAAGASTDGTHVLPMGSFHPSFETFRMNTPQGSAGQKLRTDVRKQIQNLTFDLVGHFLARYCLLLSISSQATTWDRAFGGTTMIIHIEGATVLGAPIRPEYMKADVYLPPQLITELPDTHSTIASIVQTFIESVGIPTVNRWATAARNLGWSLTQRGPVITPSTYYPQLVPSPVSPTSAHYIFRGRPYGSLPMVALECLTVAPECLTTGSHVTTSSVPEHSNHSRHVVTPSSSQSSDIYFPDDPGHMDLATTDAIDKAAALEAELHVAAAREQDHLSQISHLREELANTIAMVRAHESALDKYTSLYGILSPTPLAVPSPHRSHTPTVSPRRQFHSPSKTPTKFPKADPASCPRPYVGPHKQALNLPQFPSTSQLPQIPPGHGKLPDTGTRRRSLGPSARNLFESHDLSHLAPKVEAIIQDTAPTMWDMALHALYLSDGMHGLLMQALTADWLAMSSTGDL
jgi:hypothetical protein